MKRELANLLSLFFGSTALLLVVSNYSSFTDFYQRFLFPYGSLFITLTVFVFGYMIAIRATHVAERSSSQRNCALIRAQVAIKLADFRQAWIDALRSDISEFNSITQIAKDAVIDSDYIIKALALRDRIQIRMNTSDRDYKELVNGLLWRLNFEGARPDFDRPEVRSVTAIGQSILKREWDRLRDELKKMAKE